MSLPSMENDDRSRRLFSLLAPHRAAAIRTARRVSKSSQGSTVSAVKTRISRAKKRLRKRYAQTAYPRTGSQPSVPEES